MSVIGAFLVPHPPVILPEVGQGREKEIQATADAYREAARRIAALAPETVVVVSPHSVLYADYFHISPGPGAHGDLLAFGAAGADLTAEYDGDFVEALMKNAKAADLPAGTLGEKDAALDHGTLIPLRFLREAGVSCKVVRVGLSGLSPLVHYQLGMCLEQTAQSLARRTVLVASGDLSHKLLAEGPYGYAEEGPAFDREVTKALAEGDFLRLLQFTPELCHAAAECGLRSCQIMAGALDGREVRPELLSYEGPFGVGYAVACFTPGGAEESRRFGEAYRIRRDKQLELLRGREDACVRLARFSLETFVRMGVRAAPPPDVPEELLNRRAGAFVSLKKDGALRGCIGTIVPAAASLAEEILHNAVSAGMEDPRFDPVTAQELPELVYSVDVLGEPEPVRDALQLDAKRYGVIVSRGFRRGLLLPDLDGVDTPEEQIAIARQKAGIQPEEPVTLERFEVARHT